MGYSQNPVIGEERIVLSHNASDSMVIQAVTECAMVNILLEASIVNLPLSLAVWNSESRWSVPLLHLYCLTQDLTL